MHFYLQDVTDDLSRSMMIRGMHHHEGLNPDQRVACEICVSSVAPRRSVEARVIAVREEPNQQRRFNLRVVNGPSGNFPLTVSMSFSRSAFSCDES